ncbi:DUF5666 domain-containing protein [Marinicella sp. W31]|uniref:DUF5666 domain-containing protein n=1 Tax=Marinicella sp. W31 TaxID=3023713 RepID=UPI0037567B64
MKKYRQYLVLGAMIGSVATAGASDDDNRAVRADGQGGTGFNLNINDIRNFLLNDSTVISIDGVVDPNFRADAQGGTGYKIRYRVGSDVNDTITSGTLDSIDLINTHKGPLTSVDPLRVFNIDVLVTGNTFLDDLPAVDQLNVGDEVKISGFVDTNSSVLATRIEQPSDPLDEWKLSGYATNINATQFNIGPQVVELGSVVVDDCDQGFNEGVYVEVKATPDAQFGANDPITTTTKVECIDEGVNESPNNGIPVALEGIVDGVDVNGNFTIGDQQVELLPGTIFINGDADDIMVGSKLEVEGIFDPFNEIVVAFKIKFLEVRFKFEESVMPSDVVIGESIQLYGQTIMATPQTRDEDGIISSGLSQTTQVEVRGFVDSEGQLFATRVRERGNPDLTDVTLDGRITASNNPIIEVLGISVDTSTSLFLDVDGNGISQTDFFNAVAEGTLVEIDEANLNETTNIVSGGVIQIDEPELPQNPTLPPSVEFGLGVGTITGMADDIFSNGFD